MGRKSISVTGIILSTIGITLFWGVLSDAWGHSQRLFGAEPTVMQEYLYGYGSRIIWMLLPLAFIFYFNKELFYPKRKLITHPVLDKSLSVVLLITICYCVAGMFLQQGGIYFDHELPLILLTIKFLLVGIVEETAFRGWAYNALRNKISNRNAVLISSVLFAGLHWPAYFIKLLRFGTFDFGGFLGQSVVAFIWGLIFCWLLKKGKTIWNPIIAHSFYDLLCTVLMT